MSEPVSPDHDEPVHSDPAPAHSPVEAVYDGTTLPAPTAEADERGVRHWADLADRLTREVALRAVPREETDDE